MKKIFLCLIFFLAGCGSSSEESFRDFLHENSHPFAIATVEFFEEIPPADFAGSDGENLFISHESAFFIDLCGNGTLAVAAYKAFGNGDFYRIIYFVNGELRTRDLGGGAFFYLYELHDAPLTSLFGGGPAGNNYNIFSLTPDGLAITASLWASVSDNFYHYPTASHGDERRVTQEEFAALLQGYGFREDGRIPFVRRPHDNERGFREDFPDENRLCNMYEILSMTQSDFLSAR
jgi:hypothetical protein